MKAELGLADRVKAGPVLCWVWNGEYKTDKYKQRTIVEFVEAVNHPGCYDEWRDSDGNLWEYAKPVEFVTEKPEPVKPVELPEIGPIMHMETLECQPDKPVDKIVELLESINNTMLKMIQ